MNEMFIDRTNFTFGENNDFEKELKEKGYFENWNFFNIEELWNEVVECLKNKRFNRFFCFNGKYIVLSDNKISKDDIYLFILGKTEKEYKEYCKEQKIKYDRELKEYKTKIPELKRKYEQIGKELIDEKFHEEWLKDIEICLNGIYREYLLDCFIEIIKMSNDGATFEEIKNKFYDQGHSGSSYTLTKLLYRDLSERGKDFFKWINEK